MFATIWGRTSQRAHTITASKSIQLKYFSIEILLADVKGNCLYWGLFWSGQESSVWVGILFECAVRQPHPLLLVLLNRKLQKSPNILQIYVEILHDTRIRILASVFSSINWYDLMFVKSLFLEKKNILTVIQNAWQIIKRTQQDSKLQQLITFDVHSNNAFK